MKKQYQVPSTKVYDAGLSTSESLLLATSDINNPNPNSNATMTGADARSKQWRTDESYQIWD
jgi:hypothetical protein